MALEQIPFFDLSRQIAALRSEIDEAIHNVLDKGQFLLGEQVEKLEQGIARMVGSPAAVALASGTDALLLSLIALGVGEGDAVITTPFTFFSTASTVARLKATPLFVDIDPKSFNISPGRVEQLLSKECRRDASGAIIHQPTGAVIKGLAPVHLFGQMAEMDELESIAGRYGLFILEDAAQALGAWKDSGKGKRMAGSVGNAGIFSFYPTKNLGAFGDAGMMVTRSEDIAHHVRRLRVHGSSARDYFDEVGYLSRMDAIQAAILLTKLPHLVEWNNRRAQLAAQYVESINSHPWAGKVVLPTTEEGKGHIYHQFVIRVEQRNEVAEFLRSKGVGCEAYYSRPLHLQPALSYLGYREGDLPVVEKAARETLALPIWPELTDAEQGRIIETLDSYFH